MADSNPPTTFKKETVGRLLTLFFKDDKAKGLDRKTSNDAVIIMSEMLKVFVTEAALRAMRQAEKEDCDRVDLEHVEKILPQLLLDF